MLDFGLGLGMNKPRVGASALTAAGRLLSDLGLPAQEEVAAINIAEDSVLVRSAASPSKDFSGTLSDWGLTLAGDGSGDLDLAKIPFNHSFGSFVVDYDTCDLGGYILTISRSGATGARHQFTVNVLGRMTYGIINDVGGVIAGGMGGAYTDKRMAAAYAFGNFAASIGGNTTVPVPSGTPPTLPDLLRFGQNQSGTAKQNGATNFIVYVGGVRLDNATLQTLSAI